MAVMLKRIFLALPIMVTILVLQLGTISRVQADMISLKSDASTLGAATYENGFPQQYITLDGGITYILNPGYVQLNTGDASGLTFKPVLVVLPRHILQSLLVHLRAPVSLLSTPLLGPPMGPRLGAVAFSW